MTDAPSYKVPESLKVKFGRRLADLRNERGLIQMQLAMTAGIDRSYISDMENGKKEPSLSTLYILAQAFSMPISELLRDIER